MTARTVEPKAAAEAEAEAGLAALLRKEQQLLVHGVLSAGLGRARARSAPERVALETRRFVRLLAGWLDPTGEDLGDAVEGEVRAGAFAAAGADEIARVIAIWRRALAAFVAGTPWRSAQGRVDSALDEMEVALAQAALRWEPERLDVIAIGTSAGGLAALITVLEALDIGLPASLLIVLHVSERTPASSAAAILARHTRLAVAPAVDGGVLQLGHAYVAPPRHHLVTNREGMRLVNDPPVRMLRPSVDVLFQSAAEAFGPHLLSVVLTGTGSDGAAGTRAVHDRGGVALVQSPDSAEFAGMPEAAIATHAADRIVSLARIGRALGVAAREGRTRLLS